jgi:hypothetical protein
VTRLETVTLKPVYPCRVLLLPLASHRHFAIVSKQAQTHFSQGIKPGFPIPGYGKSHTSRSLQSVMSRLDSNPMSQLVAFAVVCRNIAVFLDFAIAGFAMASKLTQAVVPRGARQFATNKADTSFAQHTLGLRNGNSRSLASTILAEFLQPLYPVSWLVWKCLFKNVIDIVDANR